MAGGIATTLASLSRKTRLSQRAYYPQSWLTSNHGVVVANIRVGFLGEATPYSSPSSLTLAPWRANGRGWFANNCSNVEKLGGYRPCNPLHKSNSARWFGTSSSRYQRCGGSGVAVISVRVGPSSPLSSCYHHTLQSKSLLEQLGSAPWVRRSSASSGKNPRNNPRNHRTSSLTMRNFRSVEEAANKASYFLNDLNPRSLASFWSRVSQLVDPRNQRNRLTQRNRMPDQQGKLLRQLNAIFLKTIGELKRFSSKDLTQTAHGFAKIAKAIERRGHSLGTPQRILHGILIGKQSQHQKDAFQLIANASVRVLSDFDARHLCNLAYAHATLGLAPTTEDGSTLFDHIAETSLPLLDNFEAQGISNLVWSFEKVGASHPRLFEKVADHIIELNHLGNFKPQAFSNILLAFTKSGESNPRLLKKVADHIIALDSLREFDSQACSKLVWSFAKAGESHPKLFTRIADHMLHLTMNRFTSQHLATTVWAYAKSGESHPRLFETIADHIVALDSLRLFNAQDLSNTVWAFAKAEESHPLLFTKMANHMVALDSVRRFGPQELANTTWAFAKARESHPRLFETIADRIVALPNLRNFEAKACSQILWAYTSNNIIILQLFEKVAAHINENIDFKNLDEESQKNITWAFEAADKAEKSFNKK